MQHRALSLQAVSTAVLDEADKMLDMGFYKDVRKILDSLKNLKQMCMFSATISREVMDIGWLYQRDPEEITVLPVQESEPKIDQYSIQCIGREKIEIILRLMKQFEVTRAIVFCNTKYTTGMVAEQLYASGLNTACPAWRYAPVGTKQNYGGIQVWSYRYSGCNRCCCPRH